MKETALRMHSQCCELRQIYRETSQLIIFSLQYVIFETHRLMNRKSNLFVYMSDDASFQYFLIIM